MWESSPSGGLGGRVYPTTVGLLRRVNSAEKKWVISCERLQVGTGGVKTDVNNYYANLPSSYKYSRLQLKIDEQVTPKHHIMGRLSYQSDTTPGANQFGVGNVAGPGADSSSTIPNLFFWEDAMISHTWNVSSTFMIETSGPCSGLVMKGKLTSWRNAGDGGANEKGFPGFRVV